MSTKDTAAKTEANTPANDTKATKPVVVPKLSINKEGASGPAQATAG